MATAVGQSRRGTRRGRAAALAAIMTAAAILFAVGLIAGARFFLQGERLAAVVLSRLPEMQGRVQLKSVRWTLPAGLALVSGRFAAIDVYGVRVFDPEGTLVLDAPHCALDVKVSWRARSVIVRSAQLGHVSWRFATMRNRSGIGFIAAFQPPRRRAGPALPLQPRPAQNAPVFAELQSAAWDAMDAVFDFPTWGVELRQVRGTGWLRVDGTDTSRPPVLTFSAGGDALGGGLLRVLRGPGRIELPFDYVVLPRVAARAEEPEHLLLDVADARTGASSMHGSGLFTNLLPSGRPGRPPGINVDFTIDRAADAVAAILQRRGVASVQTAGDRASISASLRGPFLALRGTVETSGLDLTIGGLKVRELQLSASGAASPPAVSLDKLQFRAPAGGTLLATGRLDRQLLAAVDLRATNVKLQGWTPSWLRLGDSASLDGTAAVRADLRRGVITLSTLNARMAKRDGSPSLIVRVGTAVRARGSKGGTTVNVTDLRLVQGDLLMRGLSVASPFGHVRASGRLALGQATRTPVRLTFSAERVDLGRLVHSRVLAGRFSVGGEVRGTPERLSVHATTQAGSTLRLLGEQYRLPRRLQATLRPGGRVLVPELELTTAVGGLLRVAGEIGPRALDVVASVDGHRLGRLPWAASTPLPVNGTLGAHLRVSGRPSRPVLSGSLRLRSVTIGRVVLGDGDVNVTPSGRGLALAGMLFGRFALAGRLALDSGRPDAHVRLGFENLALARLLPRLARLRDVTATATGALAGSLGPDRSPAVELDLERLVFACTVPGARGPRRVSVRTDEPMHVRAVADTRELTLEPVQLRTEAGPLRIELTARPDYLNASLRGSLELALLQTLLPGNRVRLDGLVRTALSATGTPARPVVSGRVDVATPVRASIAGTNVDVSAGLLTFVPESAGTQVAARGLSVRVGDTGPVVLGAPGDPPASVVVLNGSQTRLGWIDLPVRARNLRFAGGGLRAEDLDLDVRLRGDLSRQLALSGEVAVSSASLRSGTPAGRDRKGNALERLLRRYPDLARTVLDLRIHTSDGGILVERRYIPDFRVQIDARIRGSITRPQVSYDMTSPDYFGRLALELFDIWRSL